MADVLSANVRSLHEILRSKSSHRGARAAQLSADLYQVCVESASETERAYCSSVLFDKENGILVFLRESVTLEEFATAQEELLRLLNDYVKILQKQALTYSQEIKEVCTNLFSRAKASKVKNATFPPLITVLELCAGTSQVEGLNVPKLVDKYLQACLKPTKHSATVRAGIFHLLGLLCELYPEHTVPLSERLIGIFMRTLKSEMLSKNKKPEMSVIAGCLRGLNCYLVNFSQSVSEGSEYAQDIYKYSRMAIDPKVSHSRYEVPRAGLSIIARHSAQFREYLCKDHEVSHMYEALYHWCEHNNRENRMVAFLALESFLQQVSLHISEGGEVKSKQVYATVFKAFIKRFRGIIDNPVSSHRELTVAIKGYGYFAAPCKLFMKSEDINYMFGEMVQRSEHVFFSSLSSGGGSEEKLQHLPALMEALASIVREMESLSETFLSSLEKLIILLFEVLPHLAPDLLLPTYYSVMRLILGVAKNRTALKTFLSHIVYQGLIRACSHPVVIQVGDGSVVVAVGDPDGGGGGGGGGVGRRDSIDLGDKKQPSFLDYVQFWVHIMDPSKLKSIQMKDSTLWSSIHQMIYDEVITSVLKIIHRLDLSASTTSSYSSIDEDPLPSSSSTDVSSPVAHVDPAAGLLPSVPRDFQIFINLVDLCKSLLPKIEATMFESWVLPFGREMIVASSSHPLVSGFYKLLSVSLTLCKKIGYFRDVRGLNKVVVAMETEEVTEKMSCLLLFRKFIREVLVRMKQYKDDLLVSCLQLLLSLPNELVEPEFSNLVPALQMTFKLGLSYLPLARTGLAALQTWSTSLPPSVVLPHFKSVLPALDDYLKTRGLDEGEGGGTTKLSRHSSGRLIAIKNIRKWRENLEAGESAHKQIQMSVLQFLGSLGGQANAGLVVERGGSAGAGYTHKAVAWDSQQHLMLALPFQDLKPTICLDPFLPRVCELATSSSDRQTKVAACELLHALVLFILGRSAQPAMQKKSPMTKIFRKIFPFLLRLGCDVEKVTEQLFRPLVLQMVHWFTRNTQYESPDTIALLDAVLDGIVDSSDTSLRDFCGLCVREFLIWSIKQTSKKQQEKSPTNMKSLLKRLYSLASHPSASKRLGAALAFNNIYTVFREEESLVDMFVIEMLVVQVHSLKIAHRDERSLGTQEQCVVAIGHLARIIKVKSKLFAKTSKKRRIPKGLTTADLLGVVHWLLGQCGSPETACREQCRYLFEQLAPLLPGTVSAGIWIRKTFEKEGGHYFVSRFERGGHLKGGLRSRPTLGGKLFSLSDTCAWLELLQAAIDCYSWVFQKQHLSPSEVFDLKSKKAMKTSEKPSCLFQAVEQFLSNLARHGMTEARRCFEQAPLDEPPTPREETEYCLKKCSVILSLLRFSTVLLTRHPKQAFSYVPKSYWELPLLEMVVAACLQPASAGFDIGDLTLSNSLSDESMECLKAIHDSKKNFPIDQNKQLLELLEREISTNGSCNLIGQLPLSLGGQEDEGGERRDHSHLNGAINGHLLLQKAGLLPLLKKLGCTEEEMVTKLVHSVLSTLRPLLSSSSSSSSSSSFSSMDGSRGTVGLSPVTSHTASLLLQLALLIGITPAGLVHILLDTSVDVPGLGLMLYQCFSGLIDDYLATHYQLIVPLLLREAQSNKIETVSTVLNGLLECSSRRDREAETKKKKMKKERESVAVAVHLLSQWKEMERWWRDGEPNHKLAAINLLRKLLSIEPNLFQLAKEEEESVNQVVTMYTSVLEDRNISLNFKSQVLDMLHHLINLSDKIGQRLRESLLKIVEYQFPLKSTEFMRGSPQYNEYITTIDKLLVAMVTSGSCILLEVIMNVMCREDIHSHEDEIQNSLSLFIREIPTASEKKRGIDVAYQFYTNEMDYPLEGRRSAAERVCVTLMRSCDEVALREFFLDHVREIMAVIEAPLTKMAGLESQLVSKICCFQFMDVLYSRLPSGALSSPDSKINRAYYHGNVKTGKEMTQAVTKAGHQAKGEDIVRGSEDRSHSELRRQYHCAAYNMVAAVISCTQSDVKFYTAFLFKEDLAKGSYLWDNLVDVERNYHFELELETPIDRKKQLMAIRSERRSPSESRDSSSPPEDTPPFYPRYMSSQYLADSSLSTEVSKYDFATAPQAFPVMPLSTKAETKEASYVISEEQIEQDELNCHECMLPLMKLIDHMTHNKITPDVPEGTEVSELPSWMACIQKKLLDTRANLNVQLFLARLITHRPKVFQPYAKYWLPCLINIVLRHKDRAEGMQYFVVDVVVTLLSWASTAIPQEGEEGEGASRLLEYLMIYCHHDNRAIFRNNLEIIKTLTELWRDRLQVPTKAIFNHFCNPSPDTKSNRTGVQLLGVVVANRLSPYDPVTAGAIEEGRFFTTFAGLMGHKYKEIYAAASEVLGMVLSYMNDQSHPSVEKVKEVIISQLLSLCGGRDEDKFLVCLHKIQSNFPLLVTRFVEKVLFMLPAFHGVYRTLCLEILLCQADVRPSLYRELREKGFHDMLKFRDDMTQLAGLNVCQNMLPLLKPRQLTELLPLLRDFGNHPNKMCRTVMYDVLIWTYNLCTGGGAGGGAGEEDQELLTFTGDVRDQLLIGLSDESEDIRLKMFEFWNQESRLSSTTLGRLTQLLAVLYSTGTEKHFLYNSTNLLLELTSRSPDYNRSIFDQPLSDCKFEEYRGIDLSWQQRYSQMTPLFAASLSSSSQTQTQTDFGGGSSSSLGSGSGVRATPQTVEFTPTQEGGGYNWMAPSLQTLDPSSSSASSSSSSSSTTQSQASSTSSSSSSLLFSLMRPPRRPLRPVRPGDGFGVGTLTGSDHTDSPVDVRESKRLEIMKLKRRFLKDRKVTSAFFAKSQSRQRIAREDMKKKQKAARSSKLVMYRKYRVGELPDTMIKYSEIIRPFQALAQRDSSLARMLFSSLYCSLFGMVERELEEEEARSAIVAIRAGLNEVLSHSTDYHAPFIGSLHDLCFNVSQLELEPTAVSRACLDSMQEPIGIMLLEKQLLVNGGKDEERGSSTKRARVAATSSNSTPVTHSTTTWVEISRLYKSLGDYDTLRGIFSSQVGVKTVTKEALAAEERADYHEALRLYKEAVGCENWEDGQPSQVEEDLWEDSMLECYSHLTHWQDLEKAVLVNLELPQLDKIWDDPYHKEHYLPHLMRAKLKLACSNVLDRDSQFTDFLNRSLVDPEKKALLESRHSTELALYSLVRGDLDRAKYYNNISLDLFLQDWSSLDVLLVKSRSTRLQELQLLIEIQEFIQFMSNTANFESATPVDGLLTKWRSRFPHPKLDPLPIWDDIITSRCMMMRKLLEQFGDSPSAIDGGLGDSMEVEGGGVNLPQLKTLFSLEHTNLYLKMADVARQQSNYSVCRKYLGLTEKAINEFFPGESKLQLDWLHSVAEMKIQQAVQDPSPTKIEPLITVLDKLGSAGKKSVGDTAHSLALRHHLLESRALDILAKSFREDAENVVSILQESRVAQLNTMMGLPPSATPTPDEVTHNLLLKSLAALKSATKAGKAERSETGDTDGLVQALMEMSLFCDHALRQREEEEDAEEEEGVENDEKKPSLDIDQFPSVIVKYSLDAMRYGCRTAVQRFPRLLQLLELYPSITADFKKKSSEVPQWMYIGWISQMLPLMDKPEGEAVEDILFSIATTYPQAICYPFKISRNDFKCDSGTVGKRRLAAINKLKASLDSQLVDDFVVALEQLNSPELAWKDMLELELQPLMEQSVGKRSGALVKKIWQQIYSQLLDCRAAASSSSSSVGSSQSSSLYGTQSTFSLQAGDRIRRFAKDHLKKIETEFGGREGAKLVKMTPKAFATAARELYDGMRAGLNKSSGPALLKEYSPWLYSFHTNSADIYTDTIEIPGQYSGLSQPLPEHHVKIAGFDEKVLVMSSMRKPKRLTIRGDDERDYMFLVKAGEDLRLDQRIEELFHVMNGILREDPACSQRDLNLTTYQVIPMTPRVGVIEWVQNTKPLKDFLQSALTDSERKNYTKPAAMQAEWLKKYKSNYKAMYQRAPKNEVEKKYREKVLALPWDMLRRGFFKLSSSPESFLILRSHFVVTYATLCICHYVLGIGDRHTSNFMIDLETGAAVGIDFGHAFGTATQFLPYPELMPFRLTPQITNLIRPHSETGQLRSCMTHVLRALHNCPDLLLATMDIFVKEPLLDWRANAKKQCKTMKLEAPEEESWYPKEKLKQAEKKLLGYNPAFVMREDLKRGHHHTPEYTPLEKILMGDQRTNLRARVGERCSTVEEQVACLICHATDPNILGRTWAGWEPWA